jgi:hypothetical protein
MATTTVAADAGQPKKIVRADATKDFFVTMITRDISLRDCIFDLLDNAIDGARRKLSTTVAGKPFAGFNIDLTFDASTFRMADNCGGIKLSDALDYAFNFGKKYGSDHHDVKGGIGLYGIGMKRAIFKMGRYCEVESHAEDASFRVIVDVEDWEKRDSWDFEYLDVTAKVTKGTSITITKVNEPVARELGDQAFANELVRIIARDYAFFIQQGLLVRVGSVVVPTYSFTLMESQQLAPLVDEYVDGAVRVRILMGIVDEVPDDIPDELRPRAVEQYGWFVVCNDRLVLAADKTDRTVWGHDGFNVWHPQYNFMAGFVFFSSDDQNLLPWTTTKRDLDASSPVYRRAVERMKAATEPFIKYSNARKFDLPTAKAAEVKEKLVDVSELRAVQEVRLPKVAVTAVRPEYVGITYRRLKRDVDEIREHLDNKWMSNKDVGEVTFNYFRKAELGK